MSTKTEKIPSTILGPADERCGECNEVLATDQRYCLNCGLRRGAPRVDVLALSAPRSGPSAPSAKRLSLSRGAAFAAAAAIAIGGIIAGTVIDGGDSAPKPAAKPANKVSKPAGSNAAQDAADAQKASEDAPDTLVTK